MAETPALDGLTALQGASSSDPEPRALAVPTLHGALPAAPLAGPAVAAQHINYVDGPPTQLATQLAHEETPLPLAKYDRASTFMRVYDSVKNVVSSKLTAANVTVLLVDVMRAVEQISQSRPMTGPEKKALALDVIGQLVEDLAPADQKEIIGSVVEALGPGIIDAIIAAAKGQLGLAEAARRSLPCLFRCFKC